MKDQSPKNIIQRLHSAYQTTEWGLFYADKKEENNE